jgi:hypothetical protein
MEKRNISCPHAGNGSRDSLLFNTIPVELKSQIDYSP